MTKKSRRFMHMLLASGLGLILLTLLGAMVMAQSSDAPRLLAEIQPSGGIEAGQSFSLTVSYFPTETITENLRFIVVWTPAEGVAPIVGGSAISSTNTISHVITPDQSETDNISYTFGFRALNAGTFTLTVEGELNDVPIAEAYDLPLEIFTSQETTPTVTATMTPTETITPTATQTPTVESTPTAIPETPVPATDTPVSETDTPVAPVATEIPTEEPPIVSTPEPGAGPSDESSRNWFQENGGLLLAVGLLFLLAAFVVGVIFFLRGRRSRGRPGNQPPAAQVGPDGTVILPPAAPQGEPAPVVEGARLVSTQETGFALRLQPDRNLIGRSPNCHVKITNRLPHWETVSREHAEIIFERGRFILRDLNSANGVYVQGRRTHENILQNGWIVGIGGVEFRFEDGSPQEPLQASGRS